MTKIKKPNIYVFSNSFHKTESAATVSKEEMYDVYCRYNSGLPLSSWDLRIRAQISFIQDNLCGVDGCDCGDWLGERK